MHSRPDFGACFNRRVVSFFLLFTLAGAPPVKPPAPVKPLATDPMQAYPLEVRYELTPRLLAPGQSPTLTVTAKNLSGRDLVFEAFDSPQCFADMYLDLKLTGPQGAVALPPCVVKTWPGTDQPLAPGASVTRELPLAQLYPAVTWEAGHYEVWATWTAARLASLTGNRFQLGARTASGGLVRFRVAKALTRVTVAVGKTVTLVPNQLELQFVAHSHKRTLVDGPRSPLMLSARLGPPGALKDVDVNISLEGTSRSFVLGGHLFGLVSYSYAESMELDYFGPGDERDE